MPSPSKGLEKRVEFEEVRDEICVDEEFIVNANEKDKGLYKKHQKNIQDFISKYQPGDEVWIYNYPDRYWENLMGRKGYVIMRKGKMVDYLMTLSANTMGKTT